LTGARAWPILKPMTPPTMLVFVMDGCGACHSYVPMLRQVGRPYSQRVRLQIIEITNSDAGKKAGNEYKIKATPTTIVQSASGKTYRRVGALPPDQISGLLAAAVR
jgi:hypothetical protein